MSGTQIDCGTFGLVRVRDDIVPGCVTIMRIPDPITCDDIPEIHVPLRQIADLVAALQYRGALVNGRMHECQKHDWRLIWTGPDDHSGVLECRRCGARRHDPELPAVVPIPKGYFPSVKKDTDK